MDVKSTVATPVPSFLQQRRPRLWCSCNTSNVKQNPPMAQKKKPQNMNESIQRVSDRKHDFVSRGRFRKTKTKYRERRSRRVKERNEIKKLQNYTFSHPDMFISFHFFILDDQRMFCDRSRKTSSLLNVTNGKRSMRLISPVSFKSFLRSGVCLVPKKLNWSKQERRRW